MAKVTVRYFAVLREQRGCEFEEVEIEAGTTVSALYAQLFPIAPDRRIPVTFSRNLRWVPADTPVQDGDEIGLLPPLGGG